MIRHGVLSDLSFIDYEKQKLVSYLVLYSWLTISIALYCTTVLEEMIRCATVRIEPDTSAQSYRML